MILALHGNVGSASDFDFLGDLVNAVDLWSWAGSSLGEAAGRLEELARGGERRGLLGYSMGGRIALQALADHPSFWDFAIIISAHPGLESEEERQRRRRSDQMWTQVIREHSWAEFLEIWNSQDVLRGSPPATRTGLESRKREICEAFRHWSLGCQENLRPKLAAYQGPVEWIAGEKDGKFSALAEEMATLLPRCHVRLVPECGHRVLEEQPGEVRAAIERVGGGSPE